jgi:hypothetical protein
LNILYVISGQYFFLSKQAQNFHNNKPDTTIRDNGQGKCLLINTRISEARSQTVLKNKNLTMEIGYMCNIKTKVPVIIIRAPGTVLNSFKRYLNNIT